MSDDDFLTSALLSRAGFAHAFSTRRGGVSEGPFASMNLARVVGDEPAAVAENYRRFGARLGVDEARLIETSQVHGDVVADVDSETPVEAWRGVAADALVAREPGLAVGVRVADCVPILVADPRSGFVAAVHAGWRGAALGVLSKALERLGAYGASRHELLVAVGPHIGPASFEVDEDVAQTIAKAAGSDDVIVRGYDKPHVALETVIRHELARAGVDPARIERVPGCTYAEPDRFHSFRRDGKRSGRLLAAIVARVGSDVVAW